MLDVLVGVVIEGFRVSTKGPRQTPAASVHPEESESGEEESRSGKHSGDEASLSGEETVPRVGGEEDLNMKPSAYTAYYVYVTPDGMVSGGAGGRADPPCDRGSERL